MEQLYMAFILLGLTYLSAAKAAQKDPVKETIKKVERHSSRVGR